MPSKSQIIFAQQVYTAAVNAKTEISPVFIAAQAAFETGWGKKKVGRFNIFGITKGSYWTGKVVMVNTHEYHNTPHLKLPKGDRIISVAKVTGKNLWYYTAERAFKDFDSLEQCLKEHERLFQKVGYKDAWKYRKDPVAFAKHICDGVGCKYATDPSYLVTITSIIKTVEKYCK